MISIVLHSGSWARGVNLQRSLLIRYFKIDLEIALWVRPNTEENGRDLPCCRKHDVTDEGHGWRVQCHCQCHQVGEWSGVVSHEGCEQHSGMLELWLLTWAPYKGSANTVVIDHFVWQLFRGQATKSDTQIFCGRKFSRIYVTTKHLMTHVTDRSMAIELCVRGYHVYMQQCMGSNCWGRATCTMWIWGQEHEGHPVATYML